MNHGSDSDEKVYDLAGLRRVVRERWWAIVLVCAVVGGVAFAASLVLAPRYSATAQITYAPEQAQLASQALSSVGGSGTSATAHNIMSDALAMSTLTFAQQVAKAMGVQTDPAELLKTVKTTPKSDVDVIDVKATGKNAADAVATANAFAGEFVKERKDASTQALAEAQKLLQARVDSLSPAEKESAYGVALSQRRDDLAVLVSMGIGDYAVLQAATTPPAPYFPRPFLNLELGLLVGLILGFALAIVLDHSDPRLKDPRSLERLMEMPVIGMVPAPGRKARKKARGAVPGRVRAAVPAIGFGKGNEALLEAMRKLRSNLGLLGFGEVRRTVLVTAAVKGEGKSALAVNLALITALSGRRVVLVDADLHDPVIHGYLGLTNTRGLSDVLSGKGPWSDYVQLVDLERFVGPEMKLVRKPAQFLCLTSGPTPSNASEMLEAPAVSRLIAELEELADHVIVDGPPVLAASDALTIAQQAGAVLLCSKLGQETADDALQARTLLKQTQASVLGIVVAGAKVKAKAERPQAERLQAERPQAERPQAERLQVERPQTERPQTERPQTERPQAERSQPERTPQTRQASDGEAVAQAG